MKSVSICLRCLFAVRANKRKWLLEHFSPSHPAAPTNASARWNGGMQCWIDPLTAFVISQSKKTTRIKCICNSSYSKKLHSTTQFRQVLFKMSFSRTTSHNVMGVSCIAAHSDRGRKAFPALSISFAIAAVHNHDRLVVWFILDSNHRYCHRKVFDAEGALYMYPENMHSTFSRHTTMTFSNFKSPTESNTTNGQSSKLCLTQT
jgi:hypothetical protein